VKSVVSETPEVGETSSVPPEGGSSTLNATSPKPLVPARVAVSRTV